MLPSKLICFGTDDDISAGAEKNQIQTFHINFLRNTAILRKITVNTF